MKKTSLLFILMVLAVAPVMATGEGMQPDKQERLFAEPPVGKKMSLDLMSKDAPEVNPVFKGINAEGSKGKYILKGEARTDNGKFLYTVEDGHNELVSETEVVLSNPHFEIELSIPEDKLPQNGSVILNLYERNGHGEILHSYPVLLESFH